MFRKQGTAEAETKADQRSNVGSVKLGPAGTTEVEIKKEAECADFSPRPPKPTRPLLTVASYVGRGTSWYTVK